MLDVREARNILGLRLRVPSKEQVSIISEMEGMGLVERRDKKTLVIK